MRLPFADYAAFILHHPDLWRTGAEKDCMQKAEQIALGISGLVSGASKVFAPLVWLLTASTNGILRLLGIDPDEDDDQVTEEESE